MKFRDVICLSGMIPPPIRETGQAMPSWHIGWVKSACMKVTTRWECMSIVPELCYVCNEVVKTCRARQLGERAKIVAREAKKST